MLLKAYLPSVLALLVFVRSAWSSPIESLQDLQDINNLEDLEKRQSGFQLATGVTGRGTAPRLELRTLQSTRPDQWNLYLLAMQRFMNVAQNDPLSYYQIAGIHGRPYRTWDNVPIIRAAGYCTHVSNLFLTWHRPYLALFEQVLFNHMQAVVNTFPAASRQRWANAAANFRIPYWDWAIAPNGQTVPQSMRDATVTVTTPSGQQSIRNPLFSYYFHPVSSADFPFSPFNVWGNTKRHPTSNNANADSNNNAFATAANNQRVGLRDRIYNLFTNSALTFTSVSTSAVGGGSGNPSAHDSFESVHDSIHVLTGGSSNGGGHMYFVDFSAFDPAFWLHHTNVDRLFNLYQALYPNKYVQPGAQQNNNAWASSGQVKDVNSPLLPFHRTQSTYWTSASSRRVRDFNYYYPETADGFTAASVRAAINRLYGAGAGVSKRDNIPFDGQTPSVNSTYGPENFNASVPINGTGYDREYSIDIQCPKHAVDGSFAIYFFLGEFDEDPLSYPYSPSLVGVNGVLSAYNPSGGDVTVGCKLPLSTYIKQKWAEGKLKSLEYDVVNEYLTANLVWRIVKVDGTLVDPADLGGLVISVESSKVKPAGSYDEFPEYIPNTTNIHGPITHGKPGGYDGSMPLPGSYSMPAGPAYSSYAPGGGYPAPSGYPSYTGGISYYSAASYVKPTATACKV